MKLRPLESSCIRQPDSSLLGFQLDQPLGRDTHSDRISATQQQDQVYQMQRPLCGSWGQSAVDFFRHPHPELAGKLSVRWRAAAGPSCSGQYSFFRRVATVVLRALAYVIRLECVNKALARQVALGLLVECAAFFVGQCVAGANGVNRVGKTAQGLVPLAVLLHEGVDLASSGSPGGQHQHIALRLAPNRRFGLIEGFDHASIVSGQARGLWKSPRLAARYATAGAPLCRESSQHLVYSAAE